MTRIALTLVTGVILLSTPASAQPPADPEATVVEGLTSRALLVGPPWWKAEKNGRMVYIFGLPTTSPRDLEWDQRLVGWRMNRAQRIILPAQYETEVEQRRYDLAAVLPADMAARLEAARLKMGAPEGRYQRVSPLAVAARLSEDLRKAYGLEWEAGYRGFHNNAALRFLTRRVETGFWKPEKTMPVDQQLACLAGVLDAVDAGPDAYRKAADAWSVGDIAGALAGPRGDRWWRCATPAMDVIARYVSEIETAVATAGVEVVVAGIPVHSMVARDGVVQRLQAAGYAVTEPSTLNETR